MKIGLAITTTPNRENVFNEWYKRYSQFSPELPLYVHNDWQYQGVSYSKNKCLSALYETECEYFFLFDDDCFLTQPKWYELYLNSKLEHACYTFDRNLINSIPSHYWITHTTGWDVAYNEYDAPNGCMMFFTRKCIEVAGGWDTDFKGYGYEHVSLSDRIFNAGLIPSRYIDIPNSKDLFEMANCESSFSISDRAQIPANYKLYQEKYLSKEFKPFK